jgi:hypothetical protein
MRSLPAILLSLVLPGLAAAVTLEDDVQNLVKVFSGDKGQHIQAVRSLAWMGVSDPRVYDVVEQRLKADAEAARDDRREQDRVAHYLRALGFSGNDKYLPTLKGFEDDVVYGRSVRNALKEFPQYQKWNPLISSRATFFDAKQSDDVNRVMNMLAADDIQLKGLGARRIRHGPHHDQPLLDRLEKEARTLYPKAKDFDVETQDAIGWMILALGSSRNPKYVPLLEEALNGTTERKIRNGAASGLKFYGAQGQQIIQKYYGR